MSRTVKILLLLLAIAGSSWYAYHKANEGVSDPAAPAASGGRRGARGGRPEGPVAVLTAAARRADVPVVLDAVGTAQALNTVTVRSQVDGRLLELAFREGQDVKRGDVLARIDPTIYQAQYDQAVAKKAQDEANLANARVDLGRYINLAQTNYGSKQQADTQRAAVAQLEAQVKSDQGAIDTARAYLDYTTITAPIDGRTGLRLVDAGNLVRASDTTGLVVITQIRPIALVFNLPQQNLRAVVAAAGRGTVPVEAVESDIRAVLDRGTLEVVDNQVDATTGTVKLKAVFPNADLRLWPGGFVNVRLTTEVLRDVVVVPTAAVQRGPNGAFLYTVVNDKAVLKPVAVTRQTEREAVIASGIGPGERVVVTGFARLTDGETVRPEDAAANAEAVAEAAANPAPIRRRGRPDGEARAPRDGADTPTASTDARPASGARPARPGFPAAGPGQSGGTVPGGIPSAGTGSAGAPAPRGGGPVP